MTNFVAGKSLVDMHFKTLAGHDVSLLAARFLFASATPHPTIPNAYLDEYTWTFEAVPGANVEVRESAFVDVALSEEQ